MRSPEQNGRPFNSCLIPNVFLIIEKLNNIFDKIFSPNYKINNKNKIKTSIPENLNLKRVKGFNFPYKLKSLTITGMCAK